MTFEFPETGSWVRLVLDTATESASTCGAIPYLVGGPVRDMALGLTFDDIDIVVVGNAEKFTLSLAAALGAKLVTNTKFLAWKVCVEGRRDIDVTKARTETYDRPGALPTVAATDSIELDLKRRDFTINAVALAIDSLKPIDPLDGLGDIGRGVLRILHDASFLDDPTRLLRASRLATRFQFELDPSTRRLFGDAVQTGALETVSADRLWKELELALEEPRPATAVGRLARDRCLTTILGVDSAFEAEVNLDAAIPDDLDRRILFMGALFQDRELQPAVRFPWDRATVTTIKTISKRTPNLWTAIDSAGSPGEQYLLCLDASPEELFLASLHSSTAKPVIVRFEQVHSMDLGVRGSDLGVPSGPWIGAALREARQAIFAGTLEPDDAPAFARKLAMEYLNN